MKFSIRTFVLAAITAVAGLAFVHTASAQIYSRNTVGDYQLQSGGNVTVNAVVIGQSGNFTIGGQQTILNAGSQPTFVFCWMSTAAGSSTSLPYGLVSSATIPANSYATLSFYGWYTGPTELYLVCRATNPSGSVLTTIGNITAAYVP